MKEPEEYREPIYDCQECEGFGHVQLEPGGSMFRRCMTCKGCGQENPTPAWQYLFPERICV